MAKEIIINAKINTGNSAKDVANVETETSKLRAQIIGAEKEVDRLSKTYGENSAQADKARKSLARLNIAYDQQVKATNTFENRLAVLNDEINKGGLNVQQLSRKLKEYQTIAFEAGANSPIGKQAIADAATLRDRLDSLNNRTKELANDGANLKAALTLGTGVVQGYQGVLGVSTLLGNENERLLETFTKLQAAQGVVNSLAAIRQSLDKDSVLVLKAKTIATLAQSKAESLYGAAVGTSTGALKAFRLALIATGIGALVVLIGTLVANWSSFVGWIQKSIEKFEWLQKAIAPIIWAYEKASELLADWGVIDSAETKRMISNTEARIEALEQERTQIGEKFDYEIAKAKAAGKNTFELEQQKRAAVIESVKAQMEATIQLVKLTGEFTDEQKEAMLALKDLAIKTQREIVVATIAEEKKKTDEYKKVLDERRKKEDESYKQQLEKEEAQYQLLTELRLSEQEKEIFNLAKSYDEKFKLAQGNAELEKELLIAQQEEVAAINKKYADEKLAAEWDQAQKLRDLRLQIKALNEGELDENASPEEVEEFYAKRRELEMANFEAQMEDLRMQLETKAITNEEFLLKKELAEKQNENNITSIKKANADAQAKIEQSKRETIANNIAATANLLQQFSQIAGEETAAGKSLAIAAATINTYRGVSDALAAQTITPFETALKFANAAAIGIAGIQNVKKIASVKVPKKGGGGSGGGVGGLSISTAQTTGQESQQGIQMFGQSFNNSDIQAQQRETLKVEVNANEISNAISTNVERSEFASL